MITPSMPRNIGFRVETLYSKNKGRVGRIIPDENGVYRGIPMMVLGEITQQQTYYDPKSVVDQILNPAAKFNIALTQNKLYGEYGHPTFIGHGYSDNEKLERLMTVAEKEHSHLFVGLYTDPPTSSGALTVRADIKPAGPHGAVLKEGLDDPIINPAFSLRAFVSTEIRPDGMKFRRVRSLTTFDTVGVSGYAGTDKAHGIGLESFSGDTHHEFEFTVLADGNLMIDQIALESFSNNEMNEIFGTSLAKITQSRTFVEVDQDLHGRFPNLYRTGLLNDFFKDI